MNADSIQRVAVIGAGLMAPGLVQVFAQAGVPVNVVSRSSASLERTRDKLRANLAIFVAEGITTSGGAAATAERVRYTTDLAPAVRDVDFVLETITEELAAKQDLFAALDRYARPDAVLATNTSGLAIRDIASRTARPERTLTAHFWNPAHLLPIVEVVANDATTPEVVAWTRAFLVRLGKEPVILRRDVRGFIGNRLQYALLREALALVQDGIASAEDVDLVVKKSFGRRLTTVGPLETCDLGGLDLVYRISSYLFPDLDTADGPPPIVRACYESGRLGAKTGAGVHDWPGDKAARALERRDRELLNWHRRDISQATD